MMRGLLGFCIRERLLVLLAMLAAAAAGWMALQSVPLDAIPKDRKSTRLNSSH